MFVENIGFGGGGHQIYRKIYTNPCVWRIGNVFKAIQAIHPLKNPSQLKAWSASTELRPRLPTQPAIFLGPQPMMIDDDG